MDHTSPYVISIADLPRQEGAFKELSLEVPAGDGFAGELIGVPAGETITLDLQLQSVQQGVLVMGEVGSYARGVCSRCLIDIARDVNEQISELIYYKEARAALEDEDDEEAEDLPIVESDAIDLEPLVRDAIVLSLPLRPLCKPECLGLCEVCGERWEDLPPDHHHEFLDPRFSALDALADQLRAQEDAEAASRENASGENALGGSAFGENAAAPDDVDGSGMSDEAPRRYDQLNGQQGKGRR
ncbi:MAG: DUF177 domain-containing protein [Actinomycetaceae bacterium]|nr:DUF177 domain-containing protein [Arcanobacterium sp.]MDD7505351.1 DUF177 domain-containing protein [Actinomycetaceae bacterium]MDY6143130.1 DUF177 domain-containing protein [Arcanobacterium sp.]